MIKKAQILQSLQTPSTHTTALQFAHMRRRKEGGRVWLRNITSLGYWLDGWMDSEDEKSEI